MEITQQTPDEPERIAYFDFDELEAQGKPPLEIARLAMREMIEPLIQDPKRRIDTLLGFGEAAMDVLKHGDRSFKRTIEVYREAGGIAVRTFDRLDPTTLTENGFGSLLRMQIFGEDCKEVQEPDGTYRGYLFIRADEAVQQRQVADRAA